MPHYDPYQAAQLVTHLADSGLTMVEFGATVKNFSDPFKTLIALVDAGKIRHDGNPVLTWCMSNTVCFTDAKDNIYPPGKTVTNTRSTARWPRSWRWSGAAVRKKDPAPSSHKVSLTCGGTCNGGHEKESAYRTPHRAASECQRIRGASFSDFSELFGMGARWLPGRL